MIKIDFYNNGFIVEGHANYSKKGSDIVCSGISAIILSSITWFDESDIINHLVDNNIPIIKIVLKNNDKNNIALDLIYHQINQIYQVYKKYIDLNKHIKNL